MTLEEIKALYEARDRAYKALSDANYDVDHKILSDVKKLARMIRPLSENKRLYKVIGFDREKEIFTCLVETYCGEGNWEIEGEYEDDVRPSSKIIIPAGWLEKSRDQVLAEWKAKEDEKKAQREAREAEEAERETREQEAHERALLEQLKAKYKEIS